MNKKLKVMWILLVLMWICNLSAVIMGIFSKTAYWVLLGCWAAFVIAIIVIDILMAIDLKKQEKELEEDRKRLEELIKGYLVTSLKEDNKEE